MTKKIFAILMTLFTILSLSACTNARKAADEESYNMDHGLDAAQYCLFMDKQISAVLNQITANMSMAKSILSNPDNKSTALASASQSLNTIEAAEQEIKTMRPPVSYEASHENTIALIEKTKSDFTAYITALGSDNFEKAGIETALSNFGFDFSALTAEYNIYYK